MILQKIPIVNPPAILRKLFPGTIWRINTNEKKLFLTFDDGPTPEITPWIIDCLKKYNASATFFCIGKNVEKYPDIFKFLSESGMKIGNHTFSHNPKNFHNKKNYFNDVDKCTELVKSNLFRPPYGKIYPWWIPDLKKRFDKIVMWDILSMDYDIKLIGKEVLNNVNTNIRPGSIIVFHDSAKAWDRLKYALPKVLEFAKREKYSIMSIH